MCCVDSQDCEPLPKLLQRDPTCLAEIVAVGFTADLGLWIRRQLTIVAVVEIEFVAHREFTRSNNTGPPRGNTILAGIPHPPGSEK